MDFWLTFTNLVVALAAVVLGIFGLLGLCQWVRRRGFRKIDRELRWSLLPLALMAAVYFFFEKIWIVHPVRPNGVAESCFPSTHTMFVATVFYLTIFLLPKYVRSRQLRLCLDAAMFALVVLVAVGRVLAGVHWPTDVIGGLAFGAFFVSVYNYVVRRFHA